MWLAVALCAEAARQELVEGRRRRCTERDRRLRDRRISRAALQSPKLSPFATLFGSDCDRSLVTLTGFDHRAFRYILARYAPLYESYTPYTTNGKIKKLSPFISAGRRRSMDATQSLALALAWTRTRGSEFVLCVMFGVTASVCSLFVRFGRAILLRVLSSDPLAAIRLPTTIQTLAYREAIGSQYSMLSDVCCVADGLKIKIERFSQAESILQSMD